MKRNEIIYCLACGSGEGALRHSSAINMDFEIQQADGFWGHHQNGDFTHTAC